MASEEPAETTEEQVETASKKPAKKAYKIHSMVRKVQTRLQRAKAPSRHRFVQRFGGGSITVRRARPATVTEDKLMAHLEELKKAVKEGRIVVKTPTHEVVDLETMSTAPAPATDSPKPAPPSDTAAADKTFEEGVGEHKPIFPEGAGQAQQVESPHVRSSLTGEDEQPIKASGGDPVKAREAEQKKATQEPKKGKKGNK